MESECGRRRDGAFSSSLQPSLVHNDRGECDRDRNSRESSRDPDTSLLFTQPVVEGKRYFLHNIIDRTVSAFVPCTSVVHAPESNSSVAQGKPQSMESECGRRRDGAFSSSLQPSLVHNDRGECDRDRNSRESSRDPDTSLLFTQPVVEGNRYFLHNVIDRTVSAFVPCTSVVHAPESNSSVAQGKPQSMESECGRRRDGAFSSSLQPSLVHNDRGECDRDRNSRESSRDPDTSLLFTQPVVEGNRYFLHNIIDRTVSAFVPCTSVVHAPESNSSVAQGKPQSMESECGRRRDRAFSSSLQPSLVHNDRGECDRDRNSRESSRDPDTSLLFTQPVFEGKKKIIVILLTKYPDILPPFTSWLASTTTSS